VPRDGDTPGRCRRDERRRACAGCRAPHRDPRRDPRGGPAARTSPGDAHGDYQAEVRAVDGAGNVDPTPAVVPFRVLADRDGNTVGHGTNAPPAGDGTNAPPAGDGTDASPARPGAPAADADGDGVLTPADCGPTNPRIFPGADDVPGDGVDQDCRGGDAAYAVLDRAFAFSHVFTGAWTRFTSLLVRPVREGDVLRLTCKGRGCPLRDKTYPVNKSARRRSLLKPLAGAKLRKGAVVVLAVSRPQTLGRVYRWTVRPGKPPSVSRKCLVPGAKKATACPTCAGSRGRGDLDEVCRRCRRRRRHPHRASAIRGE
jgi:hypothetical protein